MKRVTIVVLILLFSGCGSDNEGSQSLLVGAWITERCEQATDSKGVLINLWGKGLYEFTAQGTLTVGQVTYSDQGIIRIGQVVYSDSNCETVIDTTDPAPLDQPVLYRDLGETLLQEGIAGYGLVISLTAPKSVQSTNGFYTLNNGSLCFSDNFTIEPFRFGVSPSGSSAIDFENCLVKVVSP